MSMLRDFSKTFNSLRLLAIVSLIGFMTSTVVYIMHYQQLQEHYQQQTYVITSWETFLPS